MVHRQAPLSPQTPRDHTSDKTNLDFKKTTDDLGNLIAEKEAKVVEGLCSSKAKTDTAVSVQASASVPRAHPQSPLHSSSKEAVYFPRAVLCIVGSRVRAHMALSRCLAHAAPGHTAQSCPRLARTPPCHLACPGAGLGRPVQAVSRVPAGGTRGHPLWPQRFLSSVSCKVEPRDPGAELSRRQFRPRIGGGGVLGWGPAGSQDVLRGRAGQVLQAGILAPGVRPGPNDRALGLWTHRNSQYSRSSAGCDLGSLKKPV